MALSFPSTGSDISYATPWTTGTSTGAIAKPANTSDGDLLIAIVYDQVAGSSVTTLAGWTLLDHAVATSTRGYYIFCKYIASAAAETATSYTFTTSNSGRGAAAIFRCVGASSTQPDAVAATDVYNSAGGLTIVAPAVTAVSTAAMVLACNFANGTGGTTFTATAPGFTPLINSSTNNAGSTSSIDIAYKQLSASGTTGTVTTTLSSSASSSGGFLITIAPGPKAASGSATLNFAGTGAALQGGGAIATLNFAGTSAAKAVAAATATLNFAGTAETPAQSWVRRYQGGNQIIGHRNGCWGTFGEETREGYNNTASWLSTAALEISFWVTSDGVYVASHDQTTGRVFSGTSVDITTVTWASISSKTTLVGGYAIAKVDDIIADHPNSIFVLENKANVSNSTRAAYLNNLAPGRWISKCFGPSGIGWCNAAAVFGAPAMAYFFPTDLGNIANAFTGWTGSTQLIYELADYSSSGSAVPVQSDANTFYAYTLAHNLQTWASVINTSTQQSTASSQASTAGDVLDGYMMSNVPGLTASDSSAAVSGSATFTFAGTAAASGVGAATATLNFTNNPSVKALAPTATATVNFAGIGVSGAFNPATGSATLTFAGTALARGPINSAVATVTFSGLANSGSGYVFYQKNGSGTWIAQALYQKNGSGTWVAQSLHKMTSPGVWV